MTAHVLISLVTYNSARYLRPCLDSLKAQTWPHRVISLWDNASTDDSFRIAEEYADLVSSTQRSERNIGFCAAHNRLITRTPSDYVLVLNPDVVLESTFIEVLVQALEENQQAGSATGKLWRWRADLNVDPFSTRANAGEILDTTGMYLTPNQRHLDRGSEARDHGQYDNREYVFGASGAAALYRRAMLEDVKSGTKYFDEDFFAYREDADLAWRAQWLGWRCLYIPEARGFHVRKVLPERRSALPAEINMHSFKNRFLLRIKNMDAGSCLRYLIPIAGRDLMALAYVLVREPYSLKAFPLLVRALPSAWAARRALKARRRITPSEMRTWFSNTPVSKPL